GDGKFDPGDVDLGPFSGFSADTPLGVSTTPNLDAVTVSYLADGLDGNLGLYTTQLDLLSDHAVVNNPSLVAKVGGQIPGLAGMVTGLSVRADINQPGQLAFSLRTHAGSHA